jgi:ppGpp synthetase/RelA/SpoT-type nucleotidyltranferase
MVGDAEIGGAVAQYVREMGRYEEAARLVERRLRAALRARGVPALVSSRAKAPEDLRGKLLRKAATIAPHELHDVGAVITDLAGCRVLAYRPSDVERIEEAVQASFARAPRAGSIERHAKPSGYRATHILVTVAGDDERLWLRGAICEVQIVSLASHLWNEIEHELVYKRGAPPAEELRAALEHIRRACSELEAMVEALGPDRRG